MILSTLLACQQLDATWTKAKNAAVAAKEQASIESLPCDADVPREEPHNCISGELTCGSVIEGTTEGGDAFWKDDFYSTNFCFPAGDDRSGPERVYLMKVGAKKDVRIRLDSDCVDLDVAAIAWEYEGTCPTVSHHVAECEANGRKGGGEVRLNTFNARDYLVVVEGKNKASGPFRLTVTCGDLGG